MCGKADNDVDPLDSTNVYAWGSPPSSATGKNIGQFCWYCVRVYQCRWRIRFSSMDSWATVAGGNPQTYNEIMEQVQVCIKQVTDHGSRDKFRLHLEAPKTLDFADRQRLTVEEPSDQHVEWNFY
eukprot:2764016-Alexandrium_andersonii.AAC.1